MKKSYAASEAADVTGQSKNFPSTAVHRIPQDFADRQEKVEGLFLALLNDAHRSATDYVVNYSAGRGAE